MRFAIWVPALLAFAGAVHGQQAISAKAGLLNHVEGNALLNGYQIMVKPGEFPQIREGDEFRTDTGHQEVLLAPGVVLRVGENSALRLVSARTPETAIAFERGSAMIECTSLPKHTRLTVDFGKAAISIVKDGIYRLDSDPAQFKVYAGEARVAEGGQAQTVGKGRVLPLDGSAVARPLDDQTADALYAWSRQRSQFLAAASVSAARYVHDTGVSYSSSAWVWNPFYRSYTLVPPSGTLRNAWGFQYYGPAGGVVARASTVDSLSKDQEWRDAVDAASKQTDPCMTLH